MSPLIIEEHEKNLIWPDDIDDSQAYQDLTPITDDVGDQHRVVLEEDLGMSRLYLRHVPSDQISANVVLEFCPVTPNGFPQPSPQVTSVYVHEDYRGAKLAMRIYRLVMSHYGAIISDTHQTTGGALIWLRMVREDSVLINIMQVQEDGSLEYRYSNGEPEAYQGDSEALEAVAQTIWGGPEEVIAPLDFEILGFTPAHVTRESVVLAARLT